MNRVEFFAKSAGMLICLVFIVFPETPEIVEFVLFGTILITVGIPHGGIDHLIHNPEIDKVGLIKFIVGYLVLMLIYGLIWWFLPKLALLAFLLMSAYHFGQSHFILKPVPKKFTFMTMLLKGGFFLSVILFGSWEMTQSIIQPILEINLSKTGQLSILLFFLFGSVFTQFISGLSLSVEDGMEYLILSPLLFFSPLLISFIVYFGFWHALPSMAEEFRFLKTKPAFGSFKKFGIQLLPFSLISLLGIAVILFLGLNFLEENQVFLLFFVLISLISFPHILYMDTFLKKNYRY